MGHPLVFVKLLLPPQILLPSLTRPRSIGCSSPLSRFPRLMDTLDHPHECRKLESLQDKVKWVFLGLLHNVQNFWFVQIEKQFLRGLREIYPSTQFFFFFFSFSWRSLLQLIKSHCGTSQTQRLHSKVVPVEELPQWRVRGIKAPLGAIYDTWGPSSL